MIVLEQDCVWLVYRMQPEHGKMLLVDIATDEKFLIYWEGKPDIAIYKSGVNARMMLEKR